MLQAYPTAGYRGFGVGIFGELLLDASTRQYGTWGAVFSGPIWNGSWVGLRTGATLGWRTRDDGGLRGDAVSLAAFVEIMMPAYLYDLGLGAGLSWLSLRMRRWARDPQVEIDRDTHILACSCEPIGVVRCARP